MRKYTILVTIIPVLAGIALLFWLRPSTTASVKPRDSAAQVSQGQSTRAGTPDVPAATAAPPAPLAPPELATSNAALRRFVTRVPASQGEQNSRLTADFSARVSRLGSPSEIAAVLFVLRDHSDGDTERNEAMNLLRRSDSAPDHSLDDELIALLDRPFEGERIRSFFTQHLGLGLQSGEDMARKHRIATRLQIALDDRHLAVRREALGALVRVRDPSALTLLDQGPDAAVFAGMRDVAIRMLHALDRKEVIPAIRAHLTDPDQAVQIAAIYVLGQWRDERSRMAITAALTSNDAHVRSAGELALKAIDAVGQ